MKAGRAVLLWGLIDSLDLFRLPSGPQALLLTTNARPELQHAKPSLLRLKSGLGRRARRQLICAVAGVYRSAPPSRQRGEHQIDAAS